MNAAEGLENQQPSVLPEVFEARGQEEIVLNDCFALAELFLSAVKVEVHVETLNELGDGIRILVIFLLDDFYELAESGRFSTITHNGSRKIPEDVRAHRLNGVEVWRLVEEEVDDEIPSLWVIEVHVQAPVNKPGPLLE